MQLPKLTGTRFVGHRRSSFSAYLEDIPALIAGLQIILDDKKSKSTTKAKVQGLLKTVKDFRKLAYCVAYRDLLETIVPASKVLEGKNYYFPNNTIGGFS